jgi:hypothetical protein
MRIQYGIFTQRNVYVFSSIKLLNGIFVPNLIKRFQKSKDAPEGWIKRYPPKSQTFCTIWPTVARGILLRSI